MERAGQEGLDAFLSYSHNNTTNNISSTSMDSASRGEGEGEEELLVREGGRGASDVVLDSILRHLLDHPNLPNHPNPPDREMGVILRSPPASLSLPSSSALFALLGQREVALLEELNFLHESMNDILHRILTTENSLPPPPSLSEPYLESLPRRIISNTGEISELGGCCGISHEAFELQDTVIELPCGHSYKEENILTWLRAHNTCPICREVIEEEEEADEEEEDVGHPQLASSVDSSGMESTQL